MSIFLWGNAGLISSTVLILLAPMLRLGSLQAFIGVAPFSPYEETRLDWAWDLGLTKYGSLLGLLKRICNL